MFVNLFKILDNENSLPLSYCVFCWAWSSLLLGSLQYWPPEGRKSWKDWKTGEYILAQRILYLGATMKYNIFRLNWTAMRISKNYLRGAGSISRHLFFHRVSRSHLKQRRMRNMLVLVRYGWTTKNYICQELTWLLWVEFVLPNPSFRRTSWRVLSMAGWARYSGLLLSSWSGSNDW